MLFFFSRKLGHIEFIFTNFHFQSFENYDYRFLENFMILVKISSKNSMIEFLFVEIMVLDFEKIP